MIEIKACITEDRCVVSPYRKLLLLLSDRLTTESFEKLKLHCVNHIPRWKANRKKIHVDEIKINQELHGVTLNRLMYEFIGLLHLISMSPSFPC